MHSRWDNREAENFLDNPVALRAYTSRLLGQEEDLVLHGGGNTSLKHTVTDIFEDKIRTLFIKGSGFDLKTLPIEGLSPCRLDHLLKLARLSTLTDSQMVNEMRLSLLNPNAPTPSVESIVHALIPFDYVDHTHADAIVAISNTPDGEKTLKEIYGDSILILPYIMPGFVLAKQVYQATMDLNWERYNGIILLHHGIITFHNDAKTSYENMISLVSKAEDYLIKKNIFKRPVAVSSSKINSLDLAKIRKECSLLAKRPMLASFKNIFLSDSSLVEKGPLTPDHVIHTKRVGAVVKGADWLQKYSENYCSYFEKNKSPGLTILDSAPRYALIPEIGTLYFASSSQSLKVVEDIILHTLKSIGWSEGLGGWSALSDKDIFDVEYWELEQAKLKKMGSTKPFLGKVALVTGAASGIGRATAQSLLKEGMAVVGMDLSSKVLDLASSRSYLGLVSDVTDTVQIKAALALAVLHFGGIDLLVSNAGNFPPSTAIENMSDQLWGQTLELNLTSHQKILRECIPYLKEGINSQVIFMGSKNVNAPGPSASHYSVSKAGLTQLARVAALELAPFGIRVTTLHPDAVFDTALWSEEVIKNRAASYHMTVHEYKKKNLLKTEITSEDVASMIVALSGSSFLKSTGLQIAIDGGNDRVI